MTAEEAAREMWKLVALPKRIFIARAIAILSGRAQAPSRAMVESSSRAALTHHTPPAESHR